MTTFSLTSRPSLNKMLQKLILNCVLLAVVIQVALACNGYKANILKSENCAGPDAVVMIDPDFTVKLNKKCEIIPTGCVVTKAFKTSMSTYKVVKDGLVVKEGKVDMCTIAEQAPAEFKEYMNIFGAPTSCPVEEGKFCAKDNKLDISKYKAFLGMARGHITIDNEIEHDTGKSCFHMEMEITKS